MYDFVSIWDFLSMYLSVVAVFFAGGSTDLEAVVVVFSRGWVTPGSPGFVVVVFFAHGFPVAVAPLIQFPPIRKKTKYQISKGFYAPSGARIHSFAYTEKSKVSDFKLIMCTFGDRNLFFHDTIWG